MSKLFIVLMLLHSSFSWAFEEPQCSEANQRPIVRLNIAKSKVDDRLKDILKSTRPTIQSSLNKIKIPDFSIKPKDGEMVCDGGREMPGYDNSSKCFYMPALLVDYEVPGVTIREAYDKYTDHRGFLANLKGGFTFSIPTYLNFMDMQLKEFSIGKFDIDCYWEQEKQSCEIKVEVDKFELESHMSLRSPDDNRLLFRTIQPQRVTLDADANEEVVFRFRAHIFPNRTGKESIEIDPESIKVDLPDEIFRSPDHEDIGDIDIILQEYIVDQAYRMFFLGTDFPINGSIDQQIKYMIDNEERIVNDNQLYDEAIERIYTDLGKVRLIRVLEKEFDIDIMRKWGNTLWGLIELPIAKKISTLLESKLPFDKEFVTYIPMKRFNDSAWEGRFNKKLSRYIDIIHEESAALLKEKKWSKQRKRILKILKLLQKKIPKVYARTQTSSSVAYRLHIESLALSFKYFDEVLTLVGESTYIKGSQYNLYGFGPKDERDLKEFKKRFKVFSETKRALVNAIQLAEDNMALIEKNIKADEKEMRVKIFDIKQASDPEKIEVQFSGCLPSITKYPTDVDFNSPTPESALDRHEFSFQFPVGLFNEYVKMLHKMKYFETCKGLFGVHCDHINKHRLLRWFYPRTERKPVDAPFIYKNSSGDFVLKSKKYKFSEAKLPVIGSGAVDVEVDLNQVLSIDGRLFDEKSIDATVKLIPEFGPENITTIATNEEAVGFIKALNAAEFIKSMGTSVLFHITRFFLHTGVVEVFESNGLLSQIANCHVEAIPLFQIKEIRVTDDNFITFYGDFKEKSFDLVELKKSICKEDHL